MWFRHNSQRKESAKNALRAAHDPSLGKQCKFWDWFKELIPNWRYWLSHHNRDGEAKVETKPEAAEGFGETTNTDSEVSISILKYLKLNNSCIIQ